MGPQQRLNNDEMKTLYYEQLKHNAERTVVMICSFTGAIDCICKCSSVVNYDFGQSTTASRRYSRTLTNTQHESMN